MPPDQHQIRGRMGGFESTYMVRIHMRNRWREDALPVGGWETGAQILRSPDTGEIFETISAPYAGVVGSAGGRAGRGGALV